MKRCPNCNNSFTDDNDFCLNDGTPLVGDYQTEPTVFIRTPASSQPMFAPAQMGTEAKSNSSQYLVFGLILLLTVTAVGFGVAYFMSEGGQNKTKVEGNENMKTEIDTKQQKLEEENEKLKQEKDRLENEKLNAERQQQLEQQRRANTLPTVVTVNSPGDGYLALRSEPSSSYGDRLTKIWHGSQITLTSCNAGARGARWFYTSYGSYTGWVLDKYVRY